MLAVVSCLLALAGGLAAQNIRTGVTGLGPNGNPIITPSVSGASMGDGAAPGSEEIREENPAVAAKRYMDRAGGALAKNNFWQAAADLRMAKNLADPTQYSTLTQLYATLNQQALPVLEQADKDYQEGRYQLALETYQKLAVNLGGTAIGDKSREKLTLAEKDPAVRAAAQEVQAKSLMDGLAAMLSRSRKLPASTSAPAASQPAGLAPPAIQAQQLALLSPDQASQAYGTLQTVAKQYGSTAAGQQAAALLEQVQADPALKAKLEQARQNDDARQKLALAQNYRQAGMKDKARELLRDILKTAPKGELADKAQAELDAIGR
jgi:Tfp pilus assembly protein PilF